MTPNSSVSYPPLALAAQVRELVRDAEGINRDFGHENLGSLSLRNGFFPRRAPRRAFGPAFAAWDQIAAELPALTSSMQLRRRLAELPLLDATRLPADELSRAATLLSITAHAARQITMDDGVELPRSLRLPWEIVCRRLHRRVCSMTYDDLVSNNFVTSAADLLDARLENLELLVPAVGTQEERVFYLTQTEISARLGTLLGLYLDVAAALARSDHAQAEAGLVAMRAAVDGVTRESLPKLTAALRGRPRIDPVLWAKTVAPLAVSTGSPAPGPSGTSNPAIHLLDVLVGRDRFRSELGKEALALRAHMPFHQRNLFLHIQDRACLAEAIARSGSKTLERAFEAFADAYLGPQGFLAQHRLKVFGFIEIAFKVGRSVTIGGFSGPFLDRTWDTVDDALVASHRERPAIGCPFHGGSRRPEAPAPPTDAALPRGAAASNAAFPEVAGGDESGVQLRPLPDAGPSIEQVSRSAFYRRSLTGPERLLRVGSRAVSLQRIERAHPGGPEVLRLYVGCDATASLARVGHLASPIVRAYLDRHTRFFILRPEAPTPSADALAQLVELIFEIRNAFVLEKELLGRPFTGTEAPGEVSAWSRWHATYALARLRQSLFEGALARHLRALLRSLSLNDVERHLARTLRHADPLFRSVTPDWPGDTLEGLFERAGELLTRTLLHLVDVLEVLDAGDAPDRVAEHAFQVGAAVQSFTRGGLRLAPGRASDRARTA